MSTRRQSRRITVESPVDIVTAIDHNKDVTQQQHFPFKLYDMLEYAADSEYSSSVSWSEDGMSFAINNKDIFMECIVPLFFKQTKFRSFVSISYYYNNMCYVSHLQYLYPSTMMTTMCCLSLIILY